MRERFDALLASLRQGLEAARRRLAGVRLGAVRGARAGRRSRTSPAARRARARERATTARAPIDDSYATVVAEADDDIASITGRIDTAADSNVVLLVPKGARGMRDAALWPHIAAHARRRGLALAVVSGRRDVRGHAQANGLTTARSLSRLGRRPRRIRLGDRDVTLPSVPWRGLMSLAVLAGLVAAVVGGACYAIPSAEIVVVPPSTEFTTSVRARLSPLATAADIGGGVLPARNLRVITTASLSVETTGEAEVPDETATVTLEFTNEGEADVTIPAGTRALDDNGVAFETDEDLTVPAGDSADVDATAVSPGPLANVDADTIIHVDGFASTLSVTNPRDARGGTTRTVPGVGEEDLARVRAIADDALDRVAARALDREVEDGRVFPQTQNVAILSEVPLAKIGEPAEYLLVEYQLVVTALALTNDDLEQYAPDLVRAHLEPGMALLPGTAHATADTPAELDGGSVILTVRARGQVARLFNTEAAGGAVTGARPSAAAERLTEMLNLVEPPRITIEPSIVPWRWLPRRASRISFVLAAPGTLDAEEDEVDGEAEATGTATPSPTPTSGRAAPVRPRVVAA